MVDDILRELRTSCAGLKNCIFRSVTLDRAKRLVTVGIVTDEVFSKADRDRAESIIATYVPAYFKCETEISKLAPDIAMVKKKILEGVSLYSRPLYVTLSDEDIAVEKSGDGFSYTIKVARSLYDRELCVKIDGYLKGCFCGEFSGRCEIGDTKLENLETEETVDEIEFEVPLRYFNIEDFEIIESDSILKRAVYIADLNYISGEAVICGTVENIREKNYTNKSGRERSLLSIVINDTTATTQATYFLRQKNADKMRGIKVGDSIVLSGVNEDFRGELRFTAKTIDFGRVPKGFVPEKKQSKPVPFGYHHVFPQPYTDMEQTDLFSQETVPQCLLGKSFVVLDLETTGLNSSPYSGNMDRIIEIGAFKICDGEICESFSTFIDPQRKLSDEIVALTGITQDMVDGAPTYEEVMPDFFKFCAGSALVGHNIVGFDYKFVEHYMSQCGFIPERRLIDTIPLAQELLYLSNYKLNTVADRFGITFNHHRAIDDALATAKIFLKLIGIKKSLPKFQ